MLEALRTEVLEANLELVRRGLVIYTFGNASAVSRERGKILVACVDPTSNDGMREVRRATGLLPVACVATASQIDTVIRRCYYGDAGPNPSPDPQLDVTRGAIAEEPEGARRLEGVERRLDKLLDLVQNRRP